MNRTNYFRRTRPAKECQIRVHVEAETADRVDRLTAALDQSISSYVRNLINEDLSRRDAFNSGKDSARAEGTA